MSTVLSSLPRPQREEWIDLLRGLAVIGMVWTHACNTFLQLDLQGTVLFAQLSYWHGLVAPTFFYLAGYNRGQSTAHLGPAKPAWPTMKRLLFILGIGYVMHAPWLALLTGRLDAAAWRAALIVDVLQCLAVSCMILLVLEVWLKRYAVWMALLLILVLLKLGFTSYTTGWLVVDVYLTSQHGSIFPLLPWVGFVLCGYVMALVRSPLWWGAVMGLVLACVLPRVVNGWAAQLFFLERLGWVVLFAALAAAGWRWLVGRVGLLLKWVNLLGRQSLVCYVAHLVMMHALPLWGWRSLELGIGATLSWWGVIGTFLLLLVATILLAHGWDQSRCRAKQR
jgi:uncharacterized membrane protein